TRLEFPAEVFEFFFGDAPFKKRARIHAGCRVSLEINDVAVPVFCARPKKMIESNFIEGGGRSKGRNMSANAFLDLVGANHHSQRVPAHQALDTALHLLAARERRLNLR